MSVTLILELIAVVVGVVLAAFSIMVVLTQRRSPQSAVAWLISIVLFPFVAVPVFLVFGIRKQSTGYPAIRFSTPAQPAEGAPTAEMFHSLGAPAASAGNRFRLDTSGSDALASLNAVVDGAEARLDVLFYILEDDESGRRFVERLTARAKAGVTVRVVLDRFGSLRRPYRALTALKEAGGQVYFASRFIHPPNWLQMNQRNHRKMVIADGREVWSGGRNIGNPYLTDGRWADLSFTAAGPIVQSFGDVFAADWAVAADQPHEATEPGPADQGDAVLQLIAAGPDEPEDTLHAGLARAIHAAERRIWIAAPYFVPTDILSHALSTAARRGVDVRILVPARSNKRVTDIARGAYLRELQRHGGRVLKAHGAMLHAKMGVIDEAAWVGTANFDVRSMLLNFETVLMAHDTETVAALANWFEARSDGAEEGLPRAKMPTRLIEGLFRLGSPIL